MKQDEGEEKRKFKNGQTQVEDRWTHRRRPSQIQQGHGIAFEGAAAERWAKEKIFLRAHERRQRTDEKTKWQTNEEGARTAQVEV